MSSRSVGCLDDIEPGAAVLSSELSLSSPKLLPLGKRPLHKLGRRRECRRRRCFLIQEGNGLYAAVIMGADVLLLEDRSRMQRKPIEARLR